MSHREDEPDRVHFRSERVFSVNNQWYLQLRDLGDPLGPYTTKQQAERALNIFLEDIKANHSVAEAITHVRLVGDAYIEDDF